MLQVSLSATRKGRIKSWNDRQLRALTLREDASVAVTQLQRACSTVPAITCKFPQLRADTGKKGLQSTKRTPRSKIEIEKRRAARQRCVSSRRWHRSIFARGARHSHSMLTGSPAPSPFPPIVVSSLLGPSAGSRIRGSRLSSLGHAYTLALHTRRRPPRLSAFVNKPFSQLPDTPSSSSPRSSNHDLDYA